DRVHNIGDPIAHYRLLDPLIETFLRHAQALRRLGVNSSHSKGQSGLTVEPFHDRSKVQADDVPLPECTFRRDAMDDLLIHRGTEGIRIVSIAFEGGNPSPRSDEIFGQPIQLPRRDTWPDLLFQRLERLADQLASRGTDL